MTKLVSLAFLSILLASCGGGNETTSTGASVTAQTNSATVTACNASASFGGAGPLLTDTTNPTLEACNAAIAFTCDASVTFGGTEPALTTVTSPSLKTCLAVIGKPITNGPSNPKLLVRKVSGKCWSESCCPTPSEVGACLLQYYPACTQQIFGCSASLSMYLCTSVYVPSTSCVWEDALYTGTSTTEFSIDLHGCAGQEGICYMSM